MTTPDQMIETMTRDDELDDLLIKFGPCDYCHAPVGGPCVTMISRKRTAYPHAARWQAARRAGIIGRWRELHEIPEP